jgi:hypothetical protein
MNNIVCYLNSIKTHVTLSPTWLTLWPNTNDICCQNIGSQNHSRVLITFKVKKYFHVKIPLKQNITLLQNQHYHWENSPFWVIVFCKKKFCHVCLQLDYLVFTYLDFAIIIILQSKVDILQFFMEPSDYYDAPIDKVLHFIRSVGLIKG